jgi:trehalose/maltose transport system substrate-binding protein
MTLTRSISATARRILVILLPAMPLGSCGHSAREPVTLTYPRGDWEYQNPTWELLFQEFTRETDIHLKDLPVPETTLDSLDLSRKLLQQGSSGPDVLSVDLFWPGILAGDLIDLRPYLADEISAIEPRLMPSYTVDGKLLAVPFQANVGVLEYRTDLLREYGYDHPPKTWAQLERMAERIQTGERAKGKKDFWGYVWQGAPTEALTCNALEWQLDEAGGRIIENDQTISVNNPATIRAWERAKRWIGWISPPGVVSYQESDSWNVFDSGRAAFVHSWGKITITPGRQTRLFPLLRPVATDRTGYTSIPGGPRGWASVLGGAGLAVSRHSLHPQEAIKFVRFLIRAEIHLNEQGNGANQTAQPEFYDLPSISDAPPSEKSGQHKSSVVTRPTIVAGSTYEQVTRAYIGAVHSVLAGESGAPEAAAELEKQLVKITGFRTGPPKAAE